MSLSGRTQERRSIAGSSIVNDSVASPSAAWSGEKTAAEIAAASGAGLIDDAEPHPDKTYSSDYIETRLAAVVPSPDRVIQTADTSATLRSILVCDDTGALMSTWSPARVTAAGGVVAAAGSVSAPGVAVGSGADGIYIGAGSELAFAHAGVKRMTLSADGLLADAVNSTPIGNVSPNTGAFTTLSSSGTTTLGATSATSIDSTPIGATTRSTGAFTTLSSNGSTTLGATSASALTGTPIDNCAVGQTTPAAVRATQLRAGNGTVAAPGLRFDGASDTGLYHSGGLNLTVEGADVARFLVTEIQTIVPIQAVDGSAGAPQFSFESDASSGLYLSGAGAPAISAGGTQRATFTATGTTLTGQTAVGAGTAAAPALTLGDAGTGLFRPALNEVAFATGGTSRGTITSTGLNGMAIGSTTRSTVSGTTGNFNSTLSVTGATSLASTLAVTGQTTVQLGSVTAPSVRPTGATNSGIYWPSTSSKAVTIAGTQRQLVDANGTTSTAFSIDNVYRISNISGGTYTPVVSDTAGNQPTYLSRSASWERIGRTASAWIYVQIDQKTGVTAGSEIRISLPYAASTVGCTGQVSLSLGTPPANALYLNAVHPQGQSYCVLEWTRGAGLAATPMLWSELAPSGYFSICLQSFV